MANSIGGEERSHFRSCDKCIELVMVLGSEVKMKPHGNWNQLEERVKD